MKKALNIISTVLVWTLVVATVGMMIFTLISVNTFDQANRSIFGYKFFIVRSDSMSKTDFDAGDIVFVKNVDPATLQVGDIIAFTSQNTNNFGDTVTHKIRELTTNAYGDPAFITYGTTTDTNDETPVTYPYVLGKYTGKIPNVGSFFQFLKTTPGYILCIFCSFSSAYSVSRISVHPTVPQIQEGTNGRTRDRTCKDRRRTQTICGNDERAAGAQRTACGNGAG